MILIKYLFSGNPFPKLNTFDKPNNNWLHNVLLIEAKKEYDMAKAAHENNLSKESFNASEENE